MVYVWPDYLSSFFFSFFLFFFPFFFFLNFQIVVMLFVINRSTNVGVHMGTTFTALLIIRVRLKYGNKMHDGLYVLCKQSVQMVT